MISDGCALIDRSVRSLQDSTALYSLCHNSHLKLGISRKPPRPTTLDPRLKIKKTRFFSIRESMSGHVGGSPTESTSGA